MSKSPSTVAARASPLGCGSVCVFLKPLGPIPRSSVRWSPRSGHGYIYDNPDGKGLKDDQIYSWYFSIHYTLDYLRRCELEKVCIPLKIVSSVLFHK